MRRAAARDNSRLATFAHVISSRTTAAESKTPRARRDGPTTLSCIGITTAFVAPNGVPFSLCARA